MGWARERDRKLVVDNIQSQSFSPEEEFTALKGLIFPSQADPELQTEIFAEGGMVLDLKTGKILFSKNKEKRFYPASTTKIMTAWIALERGNLEDEVLVSINAINLEPGSKTVFLEPGDRLSLETLLYGLLLESGNDCAIAIAEYLGGSEEGFVQLMNKKVHELGLKNTHFTNSHGLYNPEHYTTPGDLAIIAKEVFKLPKFREIIQTQNYKARFKSLKGDIVRGWVNTNKLIDKQSVFFSFLIIGSKTGYTHLSRYNLVTFARKGEKEVVIVVLKDGKNEIYTDTLRLLRRVV